MSDSLTVRALVIVAPPMQNHASSANTARDTSHKGTVFVNRGFMLKALDQQEH